MTENLSQFEIDALLNQINVDGFETVSIESVRDKHYQDGQGREHRNAQTRETERYLWSLTNGTQDEIKNNRKALHHVLHANWCRSKGFSTPLDFRRWKKEQYRLGKINKF